MAKGSYVKPFTTAPKGNWQQVGEYEYQDERGKALFLVRKWLKPDGNKAFQQLLPDTRPGSWRKPRYKGEAATYWCLYRLPQLIQADRTTPVLLCEGEKDVQTVERFGYLATTSPAGAKNWKPDYAKTLSGRTVIILPDNDTDGERYCNDAGAGLKAVGCTVKVCRLPGLPDKGDVSDWFQAGRTKDHLQAELDKAALWAPCTDVNVWANLRPAPEFLAEQDDDISPIARDLIFPGCVTLLAAPRGIGKSMSSTCLAVALALGGRFRDDYLDQYSVALIDRDNPARLVKIRLRRWGAEKAESLHIMAGEEVPALTDKKAWDGFPAQDFDLVIIDSIASATEGVSEREGKETQLYMRTLRHLANRGPAIMGLLNTTKSALTYRGRGEIADRIDILYEVRDITGWTPDNGDAWWMTIPEAGEHAWQDRAKRRRGQAVFRLAFVPSKFRLGMEPDPFALEINTAASEWSLRDITSNLSDEARSKEEQRKHAERNKQNDAVNYLIRRIANAPEEQPVYKTEAITLLRDCGLTRKVARNLVEYGYRGVLWDFKRSEGRGRGEYLVLCNPRPNKIPAPKGETDEAVQSDFAEIVSDDGNKREHGKSSNDADFRDPVYCRPRQTRTAINDPSEVPVSMLVSNDPVYCRPSELFQPDTIEIHNKGSGDIPTVCPACGRDNCIYPGDEGVPWFCDACNFRAGETLVDMPF